MEPHGILRNSALHTQPKIQLLQTSMSSLLSRISSSTRVCPQPALTSPHPLCSPAPHLQFGKGPQLEELLHPELEVEAEAVEQGPDVNDLAGPQPQRGDGKGGSAGHQLPQDVVMALPNVVIHVPKSQGRWLVFPLVQETPLEFLFPSSSWSGQSRISQ